MLLCFLPIAVDVEPRGGCGGGCRFVVALLQEDRTYRTNMKQLTTTPPPSTTLPQLNQTDLRMLLLPESLSPIGTKWRSFHGTILLSLLLPKLLCNRPEGCICKNLCDPFHLP